MKSALIFLLAASFLCADPEEDLLTQRLQAHLALRDVFAAEREGRSALGLFPHSKKLHLAYIKALAQKGDELSSLKEWERFSALFPEERFSRPLLENLAWGVLKKGEESSELKIQTYALLGLSFTQDVRALPSLIRGMRSSNALLREISIQMAAQYGDEPLREELRRLLREEKLFHLRLEVIRAIGRLGLLNFKSDLEEIVAKGESREEREEAIIALVTMCDDISSAALQLLFKSRYSGLRELGVSLVLHLEKREALKEVEALLEDSSSDVRSLALYTSAVLGGSSKLLLEDPSAEVAIVSGWLALSQRGDEGPLRKWLACEEEHVRLLAAAAVGASGAKGVALAHEQMKHHKDPYVRANLALGLIGERQEVKLSCKTLYRFFLEHPEELMWKTIPPFRFLAKSELVHLPHLSGYPQGVDQAVRLELLGMLTTLRYSKAEEAVKQFLRSSSWGIAAGAAAALLEEGRAGNLDLVKELLRSDEPSIRVQAALILATVGKEPSALKVLYESYPAADREMKMRILEAIGHVGDESSLPFLMERLSEPFQGLRVVSAFALIRCLRN